VITALAFSFSAGAAIAQRVLSPEEAAKVVPIKNLNATPTEVSGVIVNNTPHIIRDIEVLIEYHWLWANEFKPGPESPGHSAIVKLDKELAPGESTTFRYVPNPPLPNRQDGRFEPEVVVAGFTTVVPPTTTSR
jgi:hypothetical protein